MTFDQSLTTFTASSIDEKLKAAYEAKLEEAKKYLAERYVFHTHITKLEKKRN